MPTTRRLDDESDADETYDEIEGIDRSRSRHEASIGEDDVGGSARAQDGEDDVDHMHLLA